MAGILVVCTGNICRSPMAEAFLRAALERRLGDDAPPVRSAGVIARSGGPAMEESVRAAAERGADISRHVVTRLSGELIAGAELIVTMATEHRVEVSNAMPGAAAKTFTLKELVRLLELRSSAPRAFDLRAVAAEADALRRSAPASPTFDEDVVDPLGMPFESYRAVAWELDEWSERLADELTGRRSRAAASAEGE